MVRNARISALEDDNYVEDAGGDMAYVDGEEEEKGTCRSSVCVCGWSHASCSFAIDYSGHGGKEVQIEKEKGSAAGSEDQHGEA